MKKFLIVLCLISLTAQAKVYCEDAGGESWTGKDGRAVYCISSQVMNWWSANSWCEEVGGELIDLTIECPKAVGTGPCPQIATDRILNQSSGWTKNAASSNGSKMTFQPRYSNLSNVSANTQTRHALCKIK